MNPLVGVGVFVLDKSRRVVLGKRKGSHGEGTWGLPGGHLELGESFETCAEREVYEETGLQIADLRFLTATNSIMDSSKHYVTIFMVAELGGEKTIPEVLEPQKCERWEWVRWEDVRTWGEIDPSQNVLPSHRLFQPLLDLLVQRPNIDLSKGV